MRTRLYKIFFRFSYSQSFLDFPSQSATDLICSIYKQTPTKVKSNLAKGTFSLVNLTWDTVSQCYDAPHIIVKTTTVNIFFGELNYQTISQIKAYDFASLLGDIGGQMGLFIGIVHSKINSFNDRRAKIEFITRRSFQGRFDREYRRSYFIKIQAFDLSTSFLGSFWDLVSKIVSLDRFQKMNG